jgi:type III pantothenate kinase
MKWVIDVGNSRCKWSLLDVQGVSKHSGVVENSALASYQFPEVCAAADEVWVANVAGEKVAYQLSLLLHGFPAKVRWLQSEASFQELKNSYSVPEKLGIDRWAALVAAWHDYAKQVPALVVNFGTAMTVDALQDQVFVGGVIAPGLRLQALAFGEHTDAVLVRDGKLQTFPCNTADAAYSGIVQGLLGVIQTQLDALTQRSAQPPLCLITGGDASLLLPHLAPLLQTRQVEMMHVPDLVLRGIYLLGSTS